MKKFVSIILVILIVISLCACGSTMSSSESKSEQSHDLTVETETIYGFYDVITEVGINRVDVGKVEKVDDWALGPRYRFNAAGVPIYVYCNMDGTINSLGLAHINLYEQGYETWAIDNFIVNSDIESAAIEQAKDLVSACLNYPASADFPLLDWSIGRSFNWYSVSSEVTAENAFGVESEIPFTAIFWVEDDSIKPIYLEVNGGIIRDEREDYPLPERQEIGVEAKSSEEGTIRIVDGQLGDYGKKVQLDSYEYVWYMVPAGKYEAVSNVKTCTVYVDKDEITRNSSGYVEMQNVATYTWNYGETIEIEVGEGEHLFNVYGADYVLTPMQ